MRKLQHIIESRVVSPAINIKSEMRWPVLHVLLVVLSKIVAVTSEYTRSFMWGVGGWLLGTIDRFLQLSDLLCPNETELALLCKGNVDPKSDESVCEGARELIGRG